MSSLQAKDSNVNTLTTNTGNCNNLSITYPVIANILNKKYRWGANFKVVGKTDPQKLSGAGAWQTAWGTLADLAEHLSQGYPFMPSLLTGNGKRWQQNANVLNALRHQWFRHGSNS